MNRFFRGDYTAVAGDTVSCVKGKHTVRFGGEYRRNNNNSYSYTPGTSPFLTVTAFINDQANGFTANSSNRAARVHMNALGAFVQDSYKVRPNLLLELGSHYDWNGRPTEALNRFVTFNRINSTLQRIGTADRPDLACNKMRLISSHASASRGMCLGTARPSCAARIQSRWTVRIRGKSIRSRKSSIRPPDFVYPDSLSPLRQIRQCFWFGGRHHFSQLEYFQLQERLCSILEFNIQQAVATNVSFSAGYYATKGANLNIVRNYNQPINGVRPYLRLSSTSPLSPGLLRQSQRHL